MKIIALHVELLPYEKLYLALKYNALWFIFLIAKELHDGSHKKGGWGWGGEPRGVLIGVLRSTWKDLTFKFDIHWHNMSETIVTWNDTHLLPSF